MSSALEKRVAKGILATPTVSGAVGKGMTVAGGGAIALTVLAGLIPFVGVFGLGVILLVLGLFMWE